MIPKTWRGAIVQNLLDLEEEIETLKKILDEKHAAAGKVMTILDGRVSALEKKQCAVCGKCSDEIVVSYTGTGEATK